MTHDVQLRELVEKLLGLLGIDGTVRVQDRETAYQISIDTEDSALLIGRGGETLNAFQTVIRLMAHRLLESTEIRIMVDVNAYRRQQEEDLLTFVTEAAERVKASGVAETLRPMTSYERHLVHEVVGQMEGAETESVGEGIERRITIRRADESVN